MRARFSCFLALLLLGMPPATAHKPSPDDEGDACQALVELGGEFCVPANPLREWVCGPTGTFCCDTLTLTCLADQADTLARRLSNDLVVPFCITVDVPPQVDVGKPCGTTG